VFWRGHPDDPPSDTYIIILKDASSDSEIIIPSAVQLLYTLPQLRHVEVCTDVGPGIRVEQKLNLWCLTTIPNLRYVTIKLMCVSSTTWEYIEDVITGRDKYTEPHQIRTIPTLKNAWGPMLWHREHSWRKIWTWMCAAFTIRTVCMDRIGRVPTGGFWIQNSPSLVYEQAI
jgi:hypothetical protein